ncbi:hypothetical protein TrRE_jg7950, partial [Triparma retinervis]
SQHQPAPAWSAEGVTITDLEDILVNLKDGVNGTTQNDKEGGKGEGVEAVEKWFVDRQIRTQDPGWVPGTFASGKTDVVGSLLSRMDVMTFESRKCLGVVLSVVCKSLVRKHASRGSGGGGGGKEEEEGNGVVVETEEDMIIQPGHIEMLVDFSLAPDTALPAGQVLRAGLMWRRNLEGFLSSVGGSFWEGLGSSNFEIASDSFQTLRYSLVHNRKISSAHLSSHYAPFFALYAGLLRSQSYITRRLSLKLLGEVLLMRDNFRVMMRYISSRDNLITMMELLRDGKANIQYEAFHVFKVFVANPRKSEEVSKILVMNKEKLIKYLEGFHKEREGEGQFREEKELVINTLRGMERGEGGGKEGGDNTNATT